MSFLGKGASFPSSIDFVLKLSQMSLLNTAKEEMSTIMHCIWKKWVKNQTSSKAMFYLAVPEDARPQMSKISTYNISSPPITLVLLYLDVPFEKPRKGSYGRGGRGAGHDTILISCYYNRFFPFVSSRLGLTTKKRYRLPPSSFKQCTSEIDPILTGRSKALFNILSVGGNSKLKLWLKRKLPSLNVSITKCSNIFGC